MASNDNGGSCAGIGCCGALLVIPVVAGLKWISDHPIFTALIVIVIAVLGTLAWRGYQEIKREERKMVRAADAAARVTREQDRHDSLARLRERSEQLAREIRELEVREQSEQASGIVIGELVPPLPDTGNLNADRSRADTEELPALPPAAVELPFARPIVDVSADPRTASSPVVRAPRAAAEGITAHAPLLADQARFDAAADRAAVAAALSERVDPHDPLRENPWARMAHRELLHLISDLLSYDGWEAEPAEAASEGPARLSTFHLGDNRIGVYVYRDFYEGRERPEVVAQELQSLGREFDVEEILVIARDRIGRSFWDITGGLAITVHVIDGERISPWNAGRCSFVAGQGLASPRS